MAHPPSIVFNFKKRTKKKGKKRTKEKKEKKEKKGNKKKEEENKKGTKKEIPKEEVNENSTWCCRKMISYDHAASTQSVL